MINGTYSYVNLIIGDFNTKSSNWWDDINDYQGILIDTLTSSLGFNQIINQATNCEPNKSPSCIDLLVTSQPNLVYNL